MQFNLISELFTYSMTKQMIMMNMPQTKILNKIKKTQYENYP